MNEEQKEYEKERGKHIDWCNDRYKDNNLELWKTEDIKKLKKGRLNYLLIFLGLVAIAGVIFYLGYYKDGFGANLICGNSTIDNTCTCPKCPENVCEVECGDCRVPNDLNLNISGE